VAGVPLNLTAVVPVNPVPVNVTVEPTRPEAGECEVIVRTVKTVKLLKLVPLPRAFATVIVPVVAPDGTMAVMEVLDPTVKPAEVPLK